MFGLIGKLLRWIFPKIGELLTPVRHAVVRATGWCVKRAGAPLAQFLQCLEDLEIVDGFVLPGIAGGTFALDWFLLSLACRKFPEKSSPSAMR